MYVRSPHDLGLELKQGEAMRLLKILYGWKRAPRIWSKAFHGAIRELGFKQLKSEQCFYYVDVEGSTVWIIVYVYDVLVLGMCLLAAETINSWLKSKFEMTDHGAVKLFLGVEFVYTKEGICIRQKHFINTVLHRFGMFYINPVNTLVVPPGSNADSNGPVFKRFDTIMYQKAIGALLYISTRTRPDIGAAVGIIARRASVPTFEDWSKVKMIFHYLKETVDFSLNFVWKNKFGQSVLLAYSGADVVQ